MEVNDVEDLSDVPILIAVMGQTGTGKSSFINKATGATLEVGKKLESCTRDIQQAELSLDGRSIILFDSPGFDDTDRPDIEILKAIGIHLQRGAEQKKFLTGVIYMRKITDNRMHHSALNNLRVLRKLCGYDNYARIALVTTFWDMKPQEGEDRETQLRTNDRYWGDMIANGATFNRHFNTRESAIGILRQFLPQKPFKLQFQDEFAAAQGDIRQTEAGKEILDTLWAKLDQYEKQLSKLAEENNRARIEKSRMEREMNQLRADMDQLRKERERERWEEKQMEREIQEDLIFKEKLISEAKAEKLRVDGEIAALKAEMEALRQDKVNEKSLSEQLSLKEGRVNEVKIAKEKAESQMHGLQEEAGGSTEAKETDRTEEEKSKSKKKLVADAEATKDKAEGEMQSLTAEINKLQLELENQKSLNENLALKMERLEAAEDLQQEADKKREEAEAALQRLQQERVQLEKSKHRESAVRVDLQLKERKISSLDEEKQEKEGEIDDILNHMDQVNARLVGQREINVDAERAMKLPAVDDIYGETREKSKRWKGLPYCFPQ